ncbi:MAG: phage integrase SAM-like domain-containing protein [Flavobacteriaceae bacterium]|nr:phage integrase SAM-like domain-containing protein [Flavobacteriaceae bacterium]
MASIKLSIQSKSDNAQIYLRLSISRGFYIKRKIGLSINSKDWSNTTGLPKQNNPTNKNFTTKLKDLTNTILKNLNEANSKGLEINGDWLSYRIDLYFNRVQEKGTQSNLLTDTIQRYIDIAPTRKNSKGGIGLSKSRINSYKGLKNVVLRYEKEQGKRLKIKDINLAFVSLFTEFMQKQNYNNGNTQKKISDIKTICLYAQLNGIETHKQIRSVTGIKTKNDYIIYLTETELEQIEQTEFKRDALINAKKWLLLGAMIGQRGNDLLNLNENNIIYIGDLKLIELTQQKGNKNVVIPFSPQMETLLQYGFPYKISIQKFNKHLKDVCEIAEVDTITEGYKYVKEDKRRVLGKYPKHELITSHDLRRTFATNNYGKPEWTLPLLMSITGHTTEKIFLNYIGKTNIDYAQQIAEIYLKQIEKAKKQTNLRVVKELAVN